MVKMKGVCNICGIEFELLDSTFAVLLPVRNNGSITFSIEKPKIQNYESHLHLCGKACLMKFINDFLIKGFSYSYKGRI